MVQVFLFPSKAVSRYAAFYTIRRLQADSPEEAERSAIVMLEQEERYRGLVETTARELGSSARCSVRVDNISHLSWWRRCFRKYSPSFIFYGDDA
jgi:hypothetical protein